MSTQTDPTTQSTQEELVLTRFFDAPRALVFEAWTNSKHLAQWWGPHGFTNPRCEWDLRPGGLIHVDMRAPDGTIYPMGGMYREIVEPERLVFTTTALDVEGKPIFEILNTILFAESGTGTMLTTRTRVLNQTGEATQYLDGQAEGWSQMLERFADFAQSLRGRRHVRAGDCAFAGNSTLRQRCCGMRRRIRRRWSAGGGRASSRRQSR